MKRIKNPNQIVGGQFYIRAFCNLYNEPNVQVIQFFGTAHTQRRSARYLGDRGAYTNTTNTNPFFTFRYADTRSRFEMYFSDAAGIVYHSGTHQRIKTALFPFSNATLARLSAAIDDPRKFMSLLNNRPLTDDEYYDHEWDCEFNRRMDRELLERNNDD